MSRRGRQQQGDGCGRVLAMVTEPRADLADAGTTQEIEGGVAQQRHDGGSLATMDEAGILAQDQVLDTVQAILDSLSANDKRAGAGHWGRWA